MTSRNINAHVKKRSIMEETTKGVSTALRTCHSFYDSENPFLSADSPLRLRKSSFLQEYEKKSKDKLSDNESDGDDEWVEWVNENDAANKENTTPRARRVIATPAVLPSPYIQNDTTTPPLPFGTPLKGIDTPVQDVDTPVKGTSVPIEDINTPVQSSNKTPAQDMTASAQDMTTPTRKRTQDVTTPVQHMTPPVQRISTPVHRINTPVRGINTPLQVVRQGISITPSRSLTSSPRRKQMRSISRRIRVRRVQRVNPAIYDVKESWYIKVGSRLSIYTNDIVCMLKHTCNVVWMRMTWKSFLFVVSLIILYDAMYKVWDYDERNFQREVSICQRELDALHCDRASMLPRIEKICQEARKCVESKKQLSILETFGVAMVHFIKLAHDVQPGESMTFKVIGAYVFILCFLMFLIVKYIFGPAYSQPQPLPRPQPQYLFLSTNPPSMSPQFSTMPVPVSPHFSSIEYPPPTNFFNG